MSGAEQFKAAVPERKRSSRTGAADLSGSGARVGGRFSLREFAIVYEAREKERESDYRRVVWRASCAAGKKTGVCESP
jgi:hypothetical protein